MRLEFSNLIDSRTFLLFYNKYSLPEKAFIVGAVHFLNITHNQKYSKTTAIKMSIDLQSPRLP